VSEQSPIARLSKLATPHGQQLLRQYLRRLTRTIARQPELLFRRSVDWARFKRRVGEYNVIDERELRATRKSDTLFIFGSGMSLNALTDAECREFERHDVMGFNRFPRQRFVRCDYHLIREVAPVRGDERSLWVQLEEYADYLRGNQLFRDAVLLVQTGVRALNGNQMIGLRLLPKTNRVFLWRTLLNRRQPSGSFSEGLTHALGTLYECVDFGFIMGWKRIVLVGVDLYDRRNFWMTREEASSPAAAELHTTARDGMIELMAQWKAIFEKQGVQLYVYNPKSLLADCLPVWPR
jgi:hypothetical protein